MTFAVDWAWGVKNQLHVSTVNWFWYLRVCPQLSDRDSGAKREDDPPGLINSPADLYALMTSAPRSILKGSGSVPRDPPSTSGQCAPPTDGQQKVVTFVGGGSRGGPAEEEPSDAGQKSPRRAHDSRRAGAKGGHSAVLKEEPVQVCLLCVSFFGCCCRFVFVFCCCGLAWCLFVYLFIYLLKA